jgi:CheY-like chemotaxis protein
MSRKYVLHVEDTWECQQLVHAVLTHNGFEVVTAENGERGVALAQENPPDVILMDIHLPGIDGLEATKQIRSLPNLSHVPVIALTAADEELDHKRAIAVGCADYLSKPFSPSHLLTLIRQYSGCSTAQV